MLNLYKQWYIDRDYTQLDLFEFLSHNLNISSAIYPGSYVHISPSFFIPYVCYVDLDKKARTFFSDIPSLENYIHESVTSYKDNTTIRFYSQDYTKPIPEPDNSFDLLISQYAGFISQPCKRYLKQLGYLLVNNSHGDAGIAALDSDYTLVYVINRRNGKYIFSQNKLNEYFCT